HNHLVMQAGAYQNGTFVVGVAKGGDEEGVPAIAGSAIIAPSGEIMAQAATLGDELIVARCDLDLTKSYKETVFNFARHRQPEAAVDVVDRAADIARAVGGEEDDEIGDLLGLGGAAERQLLQILLPAPGIAELALRPCLHQRDDAVGLDRAGIAADDAHAVVEA